MLLRTLLATSAAVLAACASDTSHVSVKKEFFTDAKGHVVGERETLRHASTGETFERVEMFTVLHSADGTPIAYEQRVPNGSIVRDSEGNPIGWRTIDLRSRGSNPQGGSTIIIR